MRIIYSFNKTGYEAQCWEREIRAASDETFTFIPFNHGAYLNPDLYLDSVQLDRLYQSRNQALLKMYDDFRSMVKDQSAEAIIVTNCPPYHPDYLKKLSVYKVLYSSDDPGATYMRNIPYLHAYHHVMYVAPGYSRDMDLGEKMRYCGMVNVDWVPISVFDFEYDGEIGEESISSSDRDIDIIYIGSFFMQKLDILTKVKKAFGSRVRIQGFFRFKHNLYLNVIHGFRGWVRPVSFRERVNLYQRAKIGFNIHWNEYGLGNQRLFHLPANGVMQICDCPSLIGRVFEEGKEIVGYQNADDLVEKIKYYLEHDNERIQIALRGHKKTVDEFRFPTVTRKAGILIKEGMKRIGWKGSNI